ncbi:MAG: caspase family protein [Cyanobacteriota bacterium]
MPNDRDYAVIIGINNYSSQYSQLNGPNRGAEEFKNILVTIGDIPNNNTNIKMITSNNILGNLNPTVSQIESAFNDIITQNNDVFSGRRLYIFLSGHGISLGNIDSKDPIDTALLTAEASNKAKSCHIAGIAYSNWFKMSAIFEDIILIMDCCRDDYSAMKARPPLIDENQIINKEDAGDVETFFIFSTKYPQKAKDSTVLNEMTPFTSKLIEGLKGAAKSDNGNHITAQSLYNYLYNLKLPNKQEPDSILNMNPDKVIFDLPNIEGDIQTNVNIVFSKQIQNACISYYDKNSKINITVKTQGQPTDNWNINLDYNKRYTLNVNEDEYTARIDTFGKLELNLTLEIN